MARLCWIIAFALLAASIAAPAWLYPGLPDRIPTHWNINGEVDGYGGKWTLSLFPAVIIFILVLFAAMSALSPRHFEVDRFRPALLYIMDVVVGLFAYMQGVLLYTVYQAVHGGPSIDIGRYFSAGLFLFFAMMGMAMGKIRKNFYVGIRVPWTLASEKVWDDTHRLGAWAMTGAGMIGVVLLALGVPAWVPFALLIASMIGLLVYSFLRYKTLEREGQLEP